MVVWIFRGAPYDVSPFYSDTHTHMKMKKGAEFPVEALKLRSGRIEESLRASVTMFLHVTRTDDQEKLYCQKIPN